VSWLDDPAHVARQYATESNLLARRALYEEVEGDQAPDVLWRTLVERRPRRVLEVGGGPGELAERMQRELGADVAFVDISPRMVDLARERCIDAMVGDVQELPFAGGSFDTVVAAWMLFHVPDLERGLSEIVRVLEPAGVLIAVTNSVEHLRELRDLLEFPPASRTFNRENGGEILSRHFGRVERVDLDVRVTVRDRAKLVAFGESVAVPTRTVPKDLRLPFVTHGRPTIFVATK